MGDGAVLKASFLFWSLIWTACDSPLNLNGKADFTVEGSWTLRDVAYGDSSLLLSDHPGLVIEKHLAGSHFAWLCYDTGSDQMIVMAGGTYRRTGDRYVETFEFYLPPGSHKVGTDQAYRYSIDHQDWQSSGHDLHYGFDPGHGEIVAIDSTSFVQNWVRVKPITQNDSLLQGTWSLKQYRLEQDSSWQTYPAFVRYVKILTPSHFYWVKYNGHYDEVMASGSGPYTYLGGDEYVEFIQAFYPHESHQVGTRIEFDLALADQTWRHRGFIKRVNRNVLVDSSLVDEIWEVHKPLPNSP